MTELPRPGTITTQNQGEVSTHLANLAMESAENRATFLSWAVANQSIYIYGESEPTGEITINAIQNAVIAGQGREPIRVVLKAVESGEPGVAYWGGPQDVAVNLFATPENPEQGLLFCASRTGDDGTLIPPDPLPREVAKQLQADVSIDQNWVVFITDETSSKSLQAVFDKLWERSGMDKRWRRASVNNSVIGWLDGFYWFDRQLLKHEILSLSPEQVYLDFDYADPDDMTYSGVDLVLEVEKACRIFPYIAGVIRDKSFIGQPSLPDNATGLGRFTDRDYKRPMIVIRAFWLRNEKYPAKATEAADGTLIEPEPGAEEYGIRQLLEIDGEIVDDRRCEYDDIPILHDTNIPIGDTPYGMGEPYRLMHLQNARNRIIRAQVNHTKFFQYPVTSVSESMNASMASAGLNFVTPGMKFVVADQLYAQTAGKLAIFTDPPAMPDSLSEVDHSLKAEQTELSGHTEVMQGRTPYDNMSGKAIGELQTAATGTLAFKALSTGDMIGRFTRLALNEIQKMTLEQVSRIISRYPPHILAAMIDRWRKTDWDVKVIVMAGAKAAIDEKEAKARQQLLDGAIDIQTYREAVDIDHALVERRKEVEAQKQMQLQQQAQVQQMAKQAAAGMQPGQPQPQQNPQQGA